MNGLLLTATGGALPGRTVTNDELSQMVDTSDAWIASRTGIRTRHWCTAEESAATLAIAAARQALERSGLSPSDISCCVCATLSAPDATPSVAVGCRRRWVCRRTGPRWISTRPAPAFCTAWPWRGGCWKRWRAVRLVIGCEALSRLMDPADRSTCVLFGDGAGAAIFRLADTPFALTLGARGSDVLHAGGPDRNGSAPITMDGRAVFRFAVETLQVPPRGAGRNAAHPQRSVVGVCHQANSRIIDHCVKALNADPAKFYKNMDRHGNTSAASIPVALNELAERGLLPAGASRWPVSASAAPDMGRRDFSV